MISNCSSKYSLKSKKFAMCEMLRYCGCAAKTVSQWTLTFSLHNHVNETCYIWQTMNSEFELYLQDKHFETIASKIGAYWYGFWQHWSNFWIWPMYKLYCDPRLPVQDVTWQLWNIGPWSHRVQKRWHHNFFFFFFWISVFWIPCISGAWWKTSTAQIGWELVHGGPRYGCMNT